MKLVGQAWVESTGRRARDLAIVGASMPMTLPITAGALLVSRWKVGEKPHFRQQRVGKNGELFTIHKVRTMPHCDVDRPSRGTLEEAANGTGNHLRIAALDELPQLLNVLKDEMSLCGPRPLIPDEIENMRQVLPASQFAEWYSVYVASRPGCVSSYVNASHAKPRDFESDCFLRAELDILDYEQATNKYEINILLKAAQTVGSAALSHIVPWQ